MSTFKLQKFSVKQTVSGMKVCSDSLLFGAFIPVANAKRILDIGAGTGLLSLMQAQKCSEISPTIVESITAVEITQEGAEEAAENFSASSWHSLLNIVHQDIQSFADKSLVKSNEQYDLIICNPPFFSQHSPTSSDNSLRHIARHTDCLTYKDLCASIAKLLTKEGVAYLLLPVAIKQEIILSFADVGLGVVEIIEISESEHHTAKVMIIKASFCMKEDMCISNTLNKFSSNDCHTEQAKQYLSSFLLRYKNTI